MIHDEKKAETDSQSTISYHLNALLSFLIAVFDRVLWWFDSLICFGCFLIFPLLIAAAILVSISVHTGLLRIDLLRLANADLFCWCSIKVLSTCFPSDIVISYLVDYLDISQILNVSY